MDWFRRVHPTGAVVTAGLLAWAGALVFYACAHRYEFANLNPRQLTKRDRLTGRVELCGISYALVCAPAVEQR